MKGQSFFIGNNQANFDKVTSQLFRGCFVVIRVVVVNIVLVLFILVQICSSSYSVLLWSIKVQLTVVVLDIVVDVVVVADVVVFSYCRCFNPACCH